MPMGSSQRGDTSYSYRNLTKAFLGRQAVWVKESFRLDSQWYLHRHLKPLNYSNIVCKNIPKYWLSGFYLFCEIDHSSIVQAGLENIGLFPQVATYFFFFFCKYQFGTNEGVPFILSGGYCEWKYKWLVKLTFGFLYDIVCCIYLIVQGFTF